MPDVSNADWVLAYQAAFKEANPEYDQPVRIRHWTRGWYQIAHPGKEFDGRKHTRNQIIEFTARLRAKVEAKGTGE